MRYPTPHPSDPGRDSECVIFSRRARPENTLRILPPMAARCRHVIQATGIVPQCVRTGTTRLSWPPCRHVAAFRLPRPPPLLRPRALFKRVAVSRKTASEALPGDRSRCRLCAVPGIPSDGIPGSSQQATLRRRQPNPPPDVPNAASSSTPTAQHLNAYPMLRPRQQRGERHSRSYPKTGITASQANRMPLHILLVALGLPGQPSPHKLPPTELPGLSAPIRKTQSFMVALSLKSTCCAFPHIANATGERLCGPHSGRCELMRTRGALTGVKASFQDRSKRLRTD